MKNNLLILLFCTGLLAACHETGPSAERSVAEQKGTIAPSNATGQKISSLVPLDRPILVESVHLSDHLGSSGVAEGDVAIVPTGSRLYLSMIFKETPPGSAARAVWIDAKGKQIAEERRALDPGTKNTTFEAPRAAKWKAGKYQAEAWMGGDKTDVKSVMLVKKK